MRTPAKASGGYYPTPPRVCDLLGECFTASTGPGEVRAWDPCCGTGAALRAVTAAVSSALVTVGVELHADRSRQAKPLLTRVLHADVFKIRCTHGAFSLLFLNPPYDEDGSGSRQELTFLKHCLPYLAAGGVLAYLIPLARLAHPKICQLLAAWFTDLRVFRFPEPEFSSFRQALVFGIKTDRGHRNPAAAGQLARTVLAAPPLAERVLPRYLLPRLTGSWDISSRAIDPLAAQRLVRHSSPLWDTPEARFYFADTRPQDCRPLLPPRKAHVATLAAAGLLNNAVIDGPQGRRLLKGSIQKVFHKDLEHSTDEKTVEREQLLITVKVLAPDGVVTTLR